MLFVFGGGHRVVRACRAGSGRGGGDWMERGMGLDVGFYGVDTEFGEECSPILCVIAVIFICI